MPVPNTHPASQADGNDRHPLLHVTRAGFRVLDGVWPGGAARLAARLAATPRRHAPPARERELLARGEPGCVALADGAELATWRFRPPGPDGAPRTDAPRVLLVHGWEGRGAQLGAAVDPLLEAGFEVLLFDHLGHGASPGRRSTVIRFRDGVLAMQRAHGPFHGVLAHSVGTVATTLALGEELGDGRLVAGRLVYVSPPWDMEQYVERFVDLFTGVPGLHERVIHRYEQRYGLRAEELRMGRRLPERHEPLLVVHDAEDRDVPLAEGRLLVETWPGAELATTEGLGHRRILRDADVVRRAVAFLAGG